MDLPTQHATSNLLHEMLLLVLLAILAVKAVTIGALRCGNDVSIVHQWCPSIAFRSGVRKTQTVQRLSEFVQHSVTRVTTVLDLVRSLVF